MAAMVNGVQDNCCQQFFGTASTSHFVGQITATANDEHGLKNEDPHSEPPHSSVSDTAGRSKNNDKCTFSNTEHEEQAKLRTSEIPDSELHLNSPNDHESRSCSRGRSRRRSRSRSVSSSSSSRSRTYCSRSRSSNRSGSHSRRHRRRYRRGSRSSSRSRSRSLTSRYRRHRSRSHRRRRGSPRRYRSRSRSCSRVRVHYGRYRSRSRSHSRSLGRRRSGFVRRPYPAAFRNWRSRSRARSPSRSRGRSPLRLTEKDRRELLEIAKANASKALGKSVDLPPSLKKDSWLSDTLNKSLEAEPAKLNKQSRNLNNTFPTEVSPQQGANLSTDASICLGNSLARSQKKEEPKKAQGQWIPIQCQRSLNRLR